jgi:hypothetical protein
VAVGRAEELMAVVLASIYLIALWRQLLLILLTAVIIVFVVGFHEIWMMVIS